MIIDYKNNGAVAQLFSVVDTATGETIDRDCPYFYADDETGIVRRYDQNKDGKYFIRSPETKAVMAGWTEDNRYRFADGTIGDESEVAWTEYRMPIRIVPRDGLVGEKAELAAKLLGTSN